MKGTTMKPDESKTTLDIGKTISEQNQTVTTPNPDRRCDHNYPLTPEPFVQCFKCMRIIPQFPDRVLLGGDRRKSNVKTN